MKLLDCRDVLPDCDMIFTGADDDEVIGDAARHAARSHGLDTGAAGRCARQASSASLQGTPLMCRHRS